MPKPASDPDDEAAYPPFANDADPWQAHFAEIDALLERTDQVLAGETPLPKRRSHLVYDPELDEAEHEDLWLDVVKRTAHWRLVTRKTDARRLGRLCVRRGRPGDRPHLRGRGVERGLHL